MELDYQTTPTVEVVAYVTSWCPDCVSAKRVLTRWGRPVTIIDIETTEGAEAKMIEAASGIKKVPTNVITRPSDRRVLIEPGDDELRAALCFEDPGP